MYSVYYLSTTLSSIVVQMEEDRLKMYLDFVNRVKDVEEEKLAY